MRDADAGAVLAIYAEGIEDRTATFETGCPSWPEWDENHHRVCRLVAEEEGGALAGWASLSPVSKRACYRGVAEVSVYVARGARGRGVGRSLLQALIRASEEEGFWTIQGVTLQGNEPSIRLQLRCGFRVVGTRERIAQLDGEWKTTVLTERRSEAVGVGREPVAGKTLQRTCD